ncbi:MAG: DUF3472 domain-containing protein [Chitinophagaceae bacterium]
MPAIKKLLAVIAILFFGLMVNAQLTIPAFTGYALPSEPGAEDDESVLFSEKEGVHNWTDVHQQLQYFFYAKNTGTISLALLAKNEKPGTQLQIGLAGKSFTVVVPAGTAFKKIKAGSFNIKTPGFYTISIKALKAPGKTIAAIQSIELTGSATEGVHFNSKPRRNAASVHLRYPVPDTAKIVAFYNEITVPQGADPVHTYYMACGFARGYFGIQVNSPTERRVIFSIWDAGNEAVDRNKVADTNKVKLLAKGIDVIAGDFGNEGTGGHSHWVYNWKVGETYKFLVTALPDSASNTTTYTGYFFSPEFKKWKLIASFKAPRDAKYLGHLYSFLEDFDGVNGQLMRKAFYGNQWIRLENGQWKELTQTSFSYDATGKAGDRIDYGAGEDNGKFYLWNGGFQPANIKYGDTFSRKPIAISPMIDYYGNADSLAQATIDNKSILDFLQNDKSVAMSSKDGLYFAILKEGTGNNVAVTDTVVAYYKGSLLNGKVFDQTKEKPATFPLNRLIKGWQLGVPLCKVGGKIRLIIPSGLAYSIRARSVDIPANSPLVFDIEVVEARRSDK